MEANNVSCSDWAVNRRAEGMVVNKQENMEVSTVQDDGHPLKNSEDISRHGEGNFHRDPEPFKPAAMTSSSLLLSETAAYNQIISLLIDIKEEQQRQWAVLRDLQARVHGQVWEEEEEELDVDLPLLTMEQLDKTERHLENSEAQRRMVSHLSRMGGATVDDAVRRLMHSVLSFNLGSELNWVGRGQKRSFRNTRLQSVLFRALKRTPVGKESTHHQFAEVVKKWLRFAPFRQRGSGRRQHLKPVEYICPKYHNTLEDCNLESNDVPVSI